MEETISVNGLILEEDTVRRAFSGLMSGFGCGLRTSLRKGLYPVDA
jgi:hypothetical protein